MFLSAKVESVVGPPVGKWFIRSTGGALPGWHDAPDAYGRIGLAVWRKGA